MELKDGLDILERVSTDLWIEVYSYLGVIQIVRLGEVSLIALLLSVASPPELNHSTPIEGLPSLQRAVQATSYLGQRHCQPHLWTESPTSRQESQHTPHRLRHPSPPGHGRSSSKSCVQPGIRVTQTD